MASMKMLSKNGALLALVWMGLAAAPAHADMEKITKSGVLRVAVYDNLAPFSDQGRGIDIDVAEALAKKVGLKLALLPFPADENLGDDLRNMVWKGHYLGYGPADVMMHVPVDKMLASQNPQVEIFAPYYTDTVRLAHSVASVPQYDGLPSMVGKKIGVEKISISAMVLLGEENGRYTEGVKIYPSGVAALEQLKAGAIDGVLANRSEIESVLRDDPRFATTDVSFQRLPKKGWSVGMAVKKDNLELAKQLQSAMDGMFASGEMKAIFAKYGVYSVKP
jgi:ABC-type amino acid transport substrate-binding protein